MPIFKDPDNEIESLFYNNCNSFCNDHAAVSHVVLPEKFS